MKFLFQETKKIGGIEMKGPTITEVVVAEVIVAEEEGAVLPEVDSGTEMIRIFLITS